VSKFRLDPELAQIVMPLTQRTNALFKFTADANVATAANAATAATTTVVLHLEHVIQTIKMNNFRSRHLGELSFKS
jgi:hypothetical protein